MGKHRSNDILATQPEVGGGTQVGIALGKQDSKFVLVDRAFPKLAMKRRHGFDLAMDATGHIQSVMHAESAAPDQRSVCFGPNLPRHTVCSSAATVAW
jgi:hypothetical protein